MKRLLFAPLAFAALLVGPVAASAAPSPHHPTPREQARWEAAHRPASRPVYYHRPVPPPRPLPAPHYHAQPRWEAHHR